MMGESDEKDDVYSQKNLEAESSVCHNGDYTDSAYECIICKSRINSLPVCSLPFDGEEHERKRVCSECANNCDRNERLVFNEIENWGNLGNPKKKIKQSSYLHKGNQELLDIVTSSKFRPLPIIKNGNCSSLGSVILNRAKLSLTNTCAFDSIFQIMLAAATDNNSVRGYIEKNKCINALFDITLDVIETKIQTRIYQKRGKTLLNYWNKEAIPNSIELVDCACNVASLANFLFRSTPSFQEIATCSGGCPPRIKSLPSITITDREMKEPLGQIMKDHVVLPDVQCQNENCEMMEQN
ncbi:hypothetical protein JTB14_009344 [Gonioctena quinquepunctata]|nr:hypothetical protein JTB14_009344 [Gonioctena quinquepunctata]